MKVGYAASAMIVSMASTGLAAAEELPEMSAEFIIDSELFAKGLNLKFEPRRVG